MTDMKSNSAGFPQIVSVVGRFPPPIDGQTLATRRLADLLDSVHALQRVDRIDTEPAGSRVAVRAPRTFKRLIHYLRLRPVIAHRLENTAPDVVLWTSVSPGMAGHLRDRVLTIPAFPESARIAAVVHRGNFDELFTRRLTRASGIRMVDLVDAFVFLSRRLSEQCAMWIPEDRRFVVPNTIDEDLLFEPNELEAKRRRVAQRSSIRVLFLSNMIRSKGYFDVVSALPLLEDQDARADFAGAWESEADRLEFEALIDQLDLRSRITVHGPVTDRAAVKRLYELCDVLALPTYYENEAQPLVLLEAMSAGLPVVVTAHGSIPEVVEENQNGCFVSARAPAEIAAALRRLTDKDTWMRLSYGAERRFDERFSPSAVRMEWTELLSSI
jgi:glycosyltransferase involved in cell wall biosynthesis